MLAGIGGRHLLTDHVIEAALGAAPVRINDGFADRYDSATVVETAQCGGVARVSLYRTRRRELALQFRVAERQLLGRQLFMPLAPARTARCICRRVVRPGSWADLAVTRRRSAGICFIPTAGRAVNR